MLPKTIIKDLDYFLCFKCYSIESLYITKCYHIHCNVCIKEIGRNDIFIKCLSCNLDTGYQPLSQKYLINISVYKSVRVLEMQKEASIIMIEKLNNKIKDYERLLEEVYKYLKENKP